MGLVAAWWVFIIVVLAFFIGITYYRSKKKLDDIYEKQLIESQEYPQIDIRYDVTNKGVPIEYLMDYPYRISGTCNKIDYTWQRFRGWPTEFQIARFRYHCIYEYEKSGKSKIVDYEVCDGYEEFSLSND